MKKTVRLLAVVMTVCMLFNTSVFAADTGADVTAEVPVGNVVEQTYESAPSSAAPEVGSYNEGVALVKSEEALTADAFAELDVVSVEPLYRGSVWYTVTLGETVTTAEAVEYLSELDCFDAVDYDYIMGATDKPEDNPNYKDQVNLGLSNIPYGWTQNGKAPGGSPGVVVAVIDTGVDYNHLDLRNNIWTNLAEIPDNGIDDDGNGYIDDIHGWNCVGDNNDPMDDNGHGTHVAGIIAAENNKIGGIGVAYNCKIMVVKAGNSSGYFNNSDIAEAIQYAYMNGASVINMSFGGSNISIAVEEALENAYITSILVAAAGNDSACNNLACGTCIVKQVSYPAALPYVIGVMSTDKNGSNISAFSNYDHYPYDSVEYEVYAVGEGVGSTWPSNKYACLNGTSMAAPTVSGIAALLRSEYSDREVYSTKFIQSQIVNTGDICIDGAHSVADVQQALTKLPKPAVNLYDYYIDDSASINSANNGNGVIDAGETVRLYISLHNRGGVASNVNVSIDTYRSTVGDEALNDPYFTFVNTSMQLSDIGTYSIRECYEDQYFEISVSPDCPNDYLVDFNIRYTYTNGLDEKDTTVYEDDGNQKAQFNISRGYHLPSVITEDTIFTDDRLYIVGQDVVIPEGVTVTFEEGCEIQFYDDSFTVLDVPNFIVHGNLIFSGTAESMIHISPSSMHLNRECEIWVCDTAVCAFDYVSAENLKTGFVEGESSQDNGSVFFSNSILSNSINSSSSVHQNCHTWIEAYDIKNCAFDAHNGLMHIIASVMKGNIFGCREPEDMSGSYGIECYDSFTNNVVVSNTRGGDSVRTVRLSGYVLDNHFMSSDGDDIDALHQIFFADSTVEENNSFSNGYRKYAVRMLKSIENESFYGANGYPIANIYGSCSDITKLWPYVVDVEMFDKDGNSITRVGKEEITVRATFNRPMDKAAGTFITFGTIEPYADYRIDGEYISDTVWEGTYTLKAEIENGQNYLKVNNACTAEDPTKTVFGEYQLHEFTIDTTAAMAMNLQANPTEGGINLTFAQDDYDTLLGYNIYRADSKDGNYVKLNPAILLPTDETFLDENAEPGKTYWYTYTVVLTDFSESNPAGRVVATAMDTIAPNMYHTPVNQGYMNNNLVISCTASDNVAISNVTLYYRTVGADAWRTLNMAKQSDRYSAAILCDDITLDGIEYYIVASDGINTIAKGSADAPYTVLIKDASAISRAGDVDGDGVITTKDALMLMQHINGDLILTDDEFKRADLSGNGNLESFEALRILQYINGNINTLVM